MNLRLIVTILVIAAAPVCAQAQKPTPAKVTKADAQKVLKIISSDKAKTRTYCQMAKLGDQMEQLMRREILRNSMRCFRKCTNWEKNWVPNMPRWSTDFRTSTNNPKARVRSVDGAIQFQSAGLNLVLLTPLWTRTAHVVPLRMVRCRFPKLRYG